MGTNTQYHPCMVNAYNKNYFKNMWATSMCQISVRCENVKMNPMQKTLQRA